MSAPACLRVEANPTKGRYVVAARDILPFDYLISDIPALAQISWEQNR